MANILFYSPFNQRSRDTESLMIAFRKQGHWVCSLSQREGHLIHDFLKGHGIETHSFVVRDSSGWTYHWRHLKFLVSFCKRNRVDIVYSHLEPANFIASIAQFFIHARVILCRHHADQYKLLRRDKDFSYRITYGLARQIIAYSNSTREYMIEEERIPQQRIIRINLGYDFSIYPQVRLTEVENLKQKYQADLLLITVGSLVPLKRPEASIHVLKSLREKGIDAKLILLGKGDCEPALKDLGKDLNISEFIFFPGYVDNVLEYLAASTFVLHPSLSEASCVSVKEAGLARRPVIACRTVGDFDDYICHNENGFLVNKDSFVDEACTIIRQRSFDKQGLTLVGENLRKSVTLHFGVDNILPYYNAINNK